MNITRPQQYFWGGTTTYTPSSLEYYLCFINNFTWAGVFISYYYYYSHTSEVLLPTYSHMVKQSIPFYCHVLGWFIGFYIRMFSIIYRRNSNGLAILILISFFFYIGASIFTTKKAELNSSNIVHILFAVAVFTSFYILNGFYCINRVEFQIKFALLILSTRIKWKNRIIFSIMEHICIHHGCVYSYPLIGV